MNMAKVGQYKRCALAWHLPRSKITLWTVIISVLNRLYGSKPTSLGSLIAKMSIRLAFHSEISFRRYSRSSCRVRITSMLLGRYGVLLHSRSKFWLLNDQVSSIRITNTHLHTSETVWLQTDSIDRTNIPQPPSTMARMHNYRSTVLRCDWLAHKRNVSSLAEQFFLRGWVGLQA